MILQALTQYYEAMLARGKIDAPGWASVKISYLLCLNADGQLTQIIPHMKQDEIGKKTVVRPVIVEHLPAPVKKTSGVCSNFLWDNSSYLLGVDQKGKPDRSRQCFSAASERHHEILDGVDSPIAHAILAFFDTWRPEQAAECPALAGQLEEVTSGGNLLFRVNGQYPQEDAAIREAWQKHFMELGSEMPYMQCLVPGKLRALHESIQRLKWVKKASHLWGTLL